MPSSVTLLIWPIMDSSLRLVRFGPVPCYFSMHQGCCEPRYMYLHQKPPTHVLLFELALSLDHKFKLSIFYNYLCICEYIFSSKLLSFSIIWIRCLSAYRLSCTPSVQSSVEYAIINTISIDFHLHFYNKSGNTSGTKENEKWCDIYCPFSSLGNWLNIFVLVRFRKWLFTVSLLNNASLIN